jgi:hypothetical protein
VSHKETNNDPDAHQTVYFQADTEPDDDDDDDWESDSDPELELDSSDLDPLDDDDADSVSLESDFSLSLNGNGTANRASPTKGATAAPRFEERCSTAGADCVIERLRSLENDAAVRFNPLD